MGSQPDEETEFAVTGTHGSSTMWATALICNTGVGNGNYWILLLERHRALSMVLCWIKDDVRRWKPFLANRVKES
ncbi:hypothetical protein T10_5155 [Trichinella papuae]|uniref:Uncharacterized protein n=1 Tax=Trichinella papuae TaxID=268474 RepID=A0A0V1MQK6_9BILA|nr:hypothetical protein T10_5155 [Trichinella papuae]